MILLIKNFFKTFIKEKVQVICLILLVLSSSIVFSAIYSSKQTMDNNYKYLLNNTNPHALVMQLNETEFAASMPEDGPSIATLDNNIYDWMQTLNNDLSSKYNIKLNYNYQDTREIYNTTTSHLFKVLPYDANPYIYTDQYGQLDQYYENNFENKVDKIKIIEGKAPQNFFNNPSADNQIMVSPYYAKKNKIKIGDEISIEGNNENKYKVVGFAISPSFFYPQFDVSNLIPNLKTQSMVYCSSTAYANKKFVPTSIKTERELCLSCTYSNVNNIKNTYSQSEIANYVKKTIDDNDNLKSTYNNNVATGIYAANDSNYPYYYRTGMIHIADNILDVLMVLIGLLTAINLFFIIVIITKKQIDRSARSIGTFKALGYSSNQILLSIITYAIVMVIISSIVGWCIGSIIQILIIDLLNQYFDLYFTTPIFSWQAVLIVLGSTLLVVLATVYFSLRHKMNANTTLLLKGVTSNK